jgi:hypothetical protein
MTKQQTLNKPDLEAAMRQARKAGQWAELTRLENEAKKLRAKAPEKS